MAGDTERGLYPKYRVFKIVEDGPDEEVTTPVFVLGCDDLPSRLALAAYSDACEETYPLLAADIRQLLKNTQGPFLKRGLPREPVTE